MLKIVIEYYENSCEIISYEKTDTSFIEYLFKPYCAGFVNIGGESYKISGGACVIDTLDFTERELRPMLVLADRKIPLPALICDDGEYNIEEYDSEFLRKLSLSELRLTKRVCELEKRIDELSKKVFNTTIF